MRQQAGREACRALGMAAALVFWAAPAVAGCECGAVSPALAYAEAEAVFSGTVTSLRFLDSPEQRGREPRTVVTFAVEQSWKGPKQESVVLHTVHNRSSCNGYAFVAGERYLVYARHQKGTDTMLGRLLAPSHSTLGVRLCGGTRPYAEADNDLRFLATVEGAAR